MLAPRLAGRDPDVCGKVHEANARFRSILVLSAWATGTERLDSALRRESIVAEGDRDRRWIGHGGRTSVVREQVKLWYGWVQRATL